MAFQSLSTLMGPDTEKDRLGSFKKQGPVTTKKIVEGLEHCEEVLLEVPRVFRPSVTSFHAMCFE